MASAIVFPFILFTSVTIANMFLCWFLALSKSGIPTLTVCPVGRHDCRVVRSIFAACRCCAAAASVLCRLPLRALRNSRQHSASCPESSASACRQVLHCRTLGQTRGAGKSEGAGAFRWRPANPAPLGPVSPRAPAFPLAPESPRAPANQQTLASPPGADEVRCCWRAP